MSTTSYPLRIPDEIMDLAALRSKEDYVDKSTALKQFLFHGAEEYVLELVSRGRISIGKGAEILHKTTWEMQELAQKHGIELGPTEEQIKKSQENLKKLVKLI